MQLEEFITFQKYNEKVYAFESGELLKDNNIDYLIEESPARFAPTFVGNALEKEFAIKIKKNDFIKVEKIQEEIILKQLEYVDSDYYLLQFSDQELMEILTNRYEWGQFDFLLAQKLLKERGKEVNPEIVGLLKDQKLKELSKREKSETVWIVAGYISAMLGGLIGIFIGLQLLTYKKTLPNGDVIHVYSESDRKQGLIILSIGIVVIILSVIIKFTELF